ncbi:MAG TPA: protein kinase [Candidatus Acidoferrales bacterium]|nr:protein kinase [Candidatus Acidoferrales bacterium]
MTGVNIAHYRILDRIGEGGMGAVWRARDETLGRLVAIKFLTTVDAERRDRLVLEARTASALNHPGIITIHEILEHEGQPCIVMEYLEGLSLDRVIRPGGMPPEEVIGLGSQIADVLAAAHRAGIVHRDLKPANVMLLSRGRIKLLDFGLAKMIDLPTPDSTTLAVATPLTGCGAIVGTLNYMSPEQAQGQPVDARSDIFSLGAMLYEMATGSKAFATGSTVSTITAILRDDPTPITESVPGFPAELERVVCRCLRKDPERRFQTAIDVRNALEELRNEPPGGRSPSLAAAPRSRAPLTWLFLALVGLGAAGVGGWLLARRAMRGQATGAPLTIRPLASLPGRKQLPIFSSDGNAVAFAWDGGQDGQNSDVYLIQLDGGKPLRISSHPASEWPQFFSPDGRRLYFTRQSESGFASYSVPALGGDETRVADGIVTDITADGRSLALVRPADSLTTKPGVFVLDLASGTERKVADDFGSMNPQFGPDGQYLFVQSGQDRDHLRLHRVPLGGGKMEAVRFPDLGDDVDRVEAVRMAPRHTRMLIAARAKASNALISFVANADGSEPKRLPSAVLPGALSPDGRQMISVRNAFAIKIYRAEAFPGRGQPAVPQNVLNTPDEEYSPRISPDGRRVLLSTLRKGRWEIWLWNADLTDGHPVFGKEGGTAGSPAWSPDGKWIAFDARTRNAAGDIWAMPADGEPKLLVDHPEDDVTPCFEPGGHWIDFTSSRTGSLQLFRVAVSGGPQTQVTQGGGFTCQYSEDGRYLYYLKTRNGGEIWRRDMTANLEEPVVPEMKSRNWKVLRDGIYLLDSQANSQLGTAPRIAVARFYRFATKEIEDLGFRTPKAIAYTGIDISPDGKWLYYSQVDSSASELLVTENLP